MQKLLDITLHKMMNRFVRNLEKWCGLETDESKLNDSYDSNFKTKIK